MNININKYKLYKMAYYMKFCKNYHNIPFLDFYEKITGKSFDSNKLPSLKKKHPNIDTLTYDNLKCSLEILKKFNITEFDACCSPHIFTMNPITVDNYAEILIECGFVKIIPNYIIRYHTLIRSRSISQLKKSNLLESNIDIEDRILNKFPNWPTTHKIINENDKDNSSLLQVRMKILQIYLNWKLNVSEEEFQKYCHQYLPLKHKPMSDIQTVIDYAVNEIKLEPKVIRRNGFIMASDPINIKLIVENVPSLAGLDIRDVVKIEPAILKSNYKFLQEIKNILEQYNISDEAQRKCLKVYCLTPKTVLERLQELLEIKEYQILATNPRVVSLLVHKSKMLRRLNKIKEVSKHTYSLNHLVSSTKVFNGYINNFGGRTCGRDIVTLICSSLDVTSDNTQNGTSSDQERSRKAFSKVLLVLKKHKYFLHVAHKVVSENIRLLKEYFSDSSILDNCHLLLYPVSEIEMHMTKLLKLRNESNDSTKGEKYNSSIDINYRHLSDREILSLILYEIEKNHHFTGDGIWSNSEQFQKIREKLMS